MNEAEELAKPEELVDRRGASYPDLIDFVMAYIEEELRSACRRHGPMRGPHEGYAVILEELDELWERVRLDSKVDPDENRKMMRAEAAQVAAMAGRFMLDLTTFDKHLGLV